MSEYLKIAVVGPGIDEEGYLGNYAYYYSRHNCECKLVAPSRKYRNKHPLISIESFEAYNLKCVKGIPFRYTDYRILFSVIKWADIVHIYHIAWPINNLAAVVAKLVYDKPLVVTTTDHIVFKGFAYRANSYLPWMLADRIIAFSYWEENWLSTVGVSKKKVSTLPFGVNYDRIQSMVRFRRDQVCESDPVEKSVTFICTSRKHPDKNLLTLVECMIEARKRTNRSIRCRLIGKISDERYFRKIQDVISESKAEGMFSLIDQVSFDELIQFYLGSDVVINLARFGTFEVVVLEAMACGLPVIVSRTVGSSEVVQREKCGFVVDPYDKEGVISRIIQLVEDRELRIVFGARSKEVVANTYNYDTMIEELKKIYSDTMLECQA